MTALAFFLIAAALVARHELRVAAARPGWWRSQTSRVPGSWNGSREAPAADRPPDRAAAGAPNFPGGAR